MLAMQWDDLPADIYIVDSVKRVELIMQTNSQQYSVIHPLSTAHSKLAKNRQPILFFIFREL